MTGKESAPLHLVIMDAAAQLCCSSPVKRRPPRVILAKIIVEIGGKLNAEITLTAGQFVDVLGRPVQFGDSVATIHFRFRRVEFQPIGRSDTEIAGVPVDEFASVQAVTVRQFGVVIGTPRQFFEDEPTPQFGNRRGFMPIVLFGESVDERLRYRRKSGNERHT
ncbi:MAG: hypothetical protein IJP68_07250 [Selenomonadaceae bacterium]|nr:hypothetical protein [Selenomonadaceae bacterium]MBR0061263.1 hypothetical protein [Selenomonadaceae bacterium]